MIASPTRSALVLAVTAALVRCDRGDRGSAPPGHSHLTPDPYQVAAEEAAREQLACSPEQLSQRTLKGGGVQIEGAIIEVRGCGRAVVYACRCIAGAPVYSCGEADCLPGERPQP
ncbi:MAG: hypothetical protein R3A51_20565 [Nannocystaceae bacterium]|nr:hypothetical protein [Myxococcales bacterium]